MDDEFFTNESEKYTIPVFEKNADEFVYLIASKYFRGVGGFYEDFNQVEDDEVIRLLNDTSPIE